jgi:acetyltransferase-like isoleucine patch superfamily enzyme
MLTIEGNIFVNSWGGNSLPSSISCSEKSTLSILGDFEIGPGVHISLAKGANLTILGRRNSTASGITCNSRIMVEKSVKIGADCIIAWDVFITDSDWHNIKGALRCEPVTIGDNVWISHGVSITKGAAVPSGCIVGAKSLVTRAGSFPEKSIIAGVPAAVRKINVEWSQ